ncbi:hypothetical protein Rhopal_005626-T1 [Rhodotorula paludigena]|uniref:DUF2415 domain-containing protein n=1 Tax=Rhodotorula paludigena TaxID=86838 RepID=A0AAV5GSU7_9BASI|nr:hypothetical protein Rhopal_005626-T1 [Rhodotorula paludigena]
MQPSSTLVRRPTYSVRATTTPSHPQLRDLLVFTPEAGNTVSLVCFDSICSVDLYATRPPEYTPLRFAPTTIAAGCGLVAVGGQSSELALRNADPGSGWCTQYLPAASPPSSTGVVTAHTGSINNSLHISPAPGDPQTPRVLVSSNDELIKVYDVGGRVPDYRAAKRRRERQRSSFARAGSSRDVEGEMAGTSGGSDGGDSPVDEQPSYDQGGECALVPMSHLDIRLQTAVNHCSVSQDGKWLVAVGDTNDVHLYDARSAAASGGYELAHCFPASEDASFSTDWSEDNVTFAVASQDGFVHVYDIRSLPSSSRPASPLLRGAQASPRKVAELRTTQAGAAGAARKVKFSPGGNRLDGGLMAFTEHRNRIHVVDSRSFESYQVIDVPLSASSASFSTPFAPPTPPNPRPRPTATQRSSPHRPTGARSSSARASTFSLGSAGWGEDGGVRTSRDEKERDELEREMRLRSELRMLEEERRAHEWHGEEEEEDVPGRAGQSVGRAGESRSGHDDEEESEEDEENEGEEAEDSEGDDESDGAGEEDARMQEEEDGDEDHGAGGHRRGDDDSSTSSVDTTRPRRFAPASPSFADRGNSTIEPSSERAAAPVRRNYSRNVPLPPAPPHSYTRLPTSAPSAFSGPFTSSLYQPPITSSAFFMPSRASLNYATSASAPNSLPIHALFSAPLAPTRYGVGSASWSSDGFGGSSAGAATLSGGAYYPASAYFPLDSAPGDLLGLDWDEEGDRLFVATGERVWEWEVDRRARRGSASWGLL